MQSTQTLQRSPLEPYKPLIAEVRRRGSIEPAANALHMTRKQVQDAIAGTEGLWAEISQAVRDYRDTKSARIVKAINAGKRFSHACMAEGISQSTVETWAATRPELWAAIQEDTQLLRESLHEKYGSAL